MTDTADSLSLSTALAGGIGGGVAYLLGYLITYTWKASAVTDALRGINLIASLLGGETIPAWKAVGWLFYNGHFVATRVPGPGGPAMVDFIARSDDPALGALYLVIPVLIVLAGGVGAWAMETADGLRPAAFVGITVTVGYFPFAVGGALLVAHPIGNTGASIAPDMITAVLLAGLVYPIVFGGIGGAIGGWLGQ